MTPERERLEARLAELMAEKRAAKGVDDAAFAKSASAIVALLGDISRLPEDNALTDFQKNTYCWALEAVAAKSSDPAIRRDAAVRLVQAYRKAVDSPRLWGDERSREFGRTLFNSMVACLYKVVKESSAEAGETALKKAATPFAELLSLRAEAFLDEAGFRKDPVTDAQRAAMTRNNGGRPVRLKAWPSVAEKAFGLLNRCIKADIALTVPESLVDFLFRNREKGDWLGFYCANAMVRSGRCEEARELLFEIVRKKPQEFWVWMRLAEAYVDRPHAAVSCLCRSLTCRIRDKEIAKAVEAKIHRQLAKMLAAMGDAALSAREIACANGAEVSADDAKRYADGAKAANRLVFGDDASRSSGRGTPGRAGIASDKNAVKFEGPLAKVAGKDFGFVKSVEIGDVFIPPRFAVKMKDHDRVVGLAAKREDKKKKRMSWCMVSVL